MAFFSATLSSMSTAKLSLLLAFLLAGCTTAPHEYANLAPPRAATIEPVRAVQPVVALVLGAGGSRGFAHIGVIKALANRSIEALSRPFAVVATERTSNTMTVFNRGNTGLAVRASSSIPNV